MTDHSYFESLFYKIVKDLKDYLDELTLVGGWLPYIYSHFLWKNIPVEPIITTDIDFGFGIHSPGKYNKTIFESLSSLDYSERHINFGKTYPIVLYKQGKVRLDFITYSGIKKELINKLIGEQIYINKINKFDFLLKHRTNIMIKDKSDKFKIHCPTPSAYLYHKGATFSNREYQQKIAKDLYYMYFILRYFPDINQLKDEIYEYRKKGELPGVYENLSEYFKNKNSAGCIMIEKENGPDFYIDDLKGDIFKRFNDLISIVKPGLF